MNLLVIFVGVIALAVVVAAAVLVRLAGRMGKAAEEVAQAARLVTELTPVSREFLDGGRAALDSWRELTGATTDMVQDVRKVSQQATTVTSHLLQGVDAVVTSRHRAILAGARAGLDVLRRFRNRHRTNGSPSDAPRESEHQPS